MVRLLTAAAILGILLAPPLAAQTGRPCAAGGQAETTAPKDILDKQDDTFIKQAAAGGMAEVELSKIAEKSENAEIKLFAEQMVRDHTAANVELTDIATALCVEVPKPLMLIIKESATSCALLMVGRLINNTYASWLGTTTKLTTSFAKKPI